MAVSTPSTAITERLSMLKKEIEHATSLNDFITGEVQLVAVSKKKSVDAILEAYEAGQRHFGENYVQELVEKATDPRLQDLLIHWHFIGHLQSNKCHSLCSVKGLSAVHSVDSNKIAMLLDRAWVSQNKKNKLSVYVQVNTSMEPTKSGVNPENCCALVDFILHSCDALTFCGLMTIGAQSGSEGRSVNEDFQLLKDCKLKLCVQFGLEPNEVLLSMGMSTNYREAVSAGANVVRIGTALFGPRD